MQIKGRWKYSDSFSSIDSLKYNVGQSLKNAHDYLSKGAGLVRYSDVLNESNEISDKCDELSSPTGSKNKKTEHKILVEKDVHSITAEEINHLFETSKGTK